MTTPLFSSPRLPPHNYNFAQQITSPSSLRTREQIALIMVEERRRHVWTWQMVWERMAAWQQLLPQYPLRTGDRIVLCLPNCVDIPILMLAAAAHGFVPVVLSPQLADNELTFITNDSQAALRVGGPILTNTTAAHLSYPQALERVTLHTAANALPTYVDTTANTPGYMVYTSGTSGSPKGVLHAHRAVWARHMMFQGWTGIEHDDIILHSGQLNWTYAMGIAILDAWRVGATSVMYEGTRNAQIWASLMQQERATIFAAVPGLYRQLVRDIQDLGACTASLRHGLCAGEPLLAPLHARWVERTGKDLFEALGMSECSTYVSSGPTTPTHPGSPGKPQQGRRIAILPLDGGDTPAPTGEQGHLAIHRSDPGLMLGYYRNPDATQDAMRGEWFLTGDVAAFDTQGYLHYHGRSDDIINALGYRVGPAEVETVLLQHPFVDSVAVTDYSPREGVNLIAAHLVLQKDVVWNQDTEVQLRTWAEAHLATYKCPHVYRIRQTLPRNRSGKIMRRVLRDQDLNSKP